LIRWRVFDLLSTTGHSYLPPRISNNIAEGFERGSTTELIHFLYIARGSAGEVRSMLCVIERMSRGSVAHRTSASRWLVWLAK